MDLFGLVAYISIGSNKYDFVIVDEYSRFTWVFFLQDKSEVQETFKKFARRAQNKFEVKIKRIRSDNGSDFKNTSIEELLDEEGIKHEFLAPYTPKQNGVVERKNRTLIEAARTMLDEYKTSDQFWAEAVNTACHAINRLYLHKTMKETAYEILTGNKPKVHYFRVFGSKCFILNKKSKSSIFAPKLNEGFILGYGSNTHAYRVFNKISGCVEIAKDVTFDESNGSQDQIFQEAAPTPFHGINDDQDEGFEDQLHEEEDQEPIQRQQLLPHPRVHQSIQRDHPVDNILGSIRRGVTTRSL